jgi:opacity protein-like surface antigen
MSTRHCLAGLAGFFFLAGMTPVRASDVPVAPEPVSNTYFNVEGGYVNLDGEKVQAFLSGPDSDTLSERFLNISDGYYGRVELGHRWDTGIFNGIFNGIGAYAQGWGSDKEDTSETDFGAGLAYQHNGNLRVNTLGCSTDGQPCSTGRADLDRSLIEGGLRFFHDFGGEMSPGDVSLGIEPFVAFIDEDTDSTIGFSSGSFSPTSTRSSDLNATAFGALLALDARHAILERTVLITRIAAGAYYMDADADTDHTFLPDDSVSDDLSSNFWGFRGQLALGVEQMLTETASIGVIGRLDYWSDFPSMDWTDYTPSKGSGSDNSIAEDDFLALSIGVRLSLQFGI